MFSEVFNFVKNLTFLLYKAHETEQLKNVHTHWQRHTI